MKKAFVFKTIFLFILIICVNAFSESKIISGMIVFEDDTTLEFHDVLHLWVDIIGNKEANPPSKKSIPIKFENSIRLVPLSKLKNFWIKNYSGAKGTAVIKTITGIELECWYDKIMYIKVKVLDKLTGDYIEQKFYFVAPYTGKLIIREIVFYNFQ